MPHPHNTGQDEKGPSELVTAIGSTIASTRQVSIKVSMPGSMHLMTSGDSRKEVSIFGR